MPATVNAEQNRPDGIQPDADTGCDDELQVAICVRVLELEMESNRSNGEYTYQEINRYGCGLLV